MKLESVKFDHTRDGLRRRGRNGVRWDRAGDVGEVHCLLTDAFFRLLFFSIRRFPFQSVHFERSSFAFLGSFPLGITRAKHRKESRWAERTQGISGRGYAGVSRRGEFWGLNVERRWA